MENCKEIFTKIYTDSITREGSAELLENLNKQDFFTAPASTRFHGNYEGGLVEHSINVYKNLKMLNSMYKLSESQETIAIISLLHDLCKMNYYVTDYRNVKDENGKWNKVPYYTVKDSFPYGHGEKSVFIITQFMKLTPEEAMCIRWHMGGFDYTSRGGDYGISEAYNKYPLASLLHTADLLATYIDKV